MELALARYRLLFNHPFGTAHGLRDGTDAVFVRLSRGVHHGHGEATFPPYLPYDQESVYEELTTFWLKAFEQLSGLTDASWTASMAGLSAPARAALSTAYYDLTAKEMNMPICERIGMRSDPNDNAGQCMVTLGQSAPEEIPAKLQELPGTSILKVKLGSIHDRDALNIIKTLDNRSLFLDANQGWTDPDQALMAISTAGRSRVIGLEQPFAKERWDLHAELRRSTDVPIFGDESIQGMDDLDRASSAFDGVNLKLMKCGGLDIALEMARAARQRGFRIMLGSMSESSLGCAAMASLARLADFVDLDGPWLVSNDPFEGMGMRGGRVDMEPGAGIVVRPRLGLELNWKTVGA